MDATFDVEVQFREHSPVRFFWRTREAADAFVAVLEMREGTPTDVTGYDVDYE